MKCISGPCDVSYESRTDRLIINNFRELGERGGVCYEEVNEAAIGRHPSDLNLRAHDATYNEHKFIIDDQAVVVSVPASIINVADLTWFSQIPVQDPATSSSNAFPSAGDDVFSGILDDVLEDVFA